MILLFEKQVPNNENFIPFLLNVSPNTIFMRIIGELLGRQKGNLKKRYKSPHIS